MINSEQHVTIENNKCKHMKVKKRTKRIIVSILIIIALIIYCGYNFKEQKFQLGEVIAPSSSGNVKQTLANLDTVKGFSNPIVHLAYKYYLKRKYHNRFIKNEEEKTSSNPILNEISNIYKEYWKIKLLKKSNIAQADSLLQRNLYTYLKNEKLTELSFEDYGSSELNRVIELQGAKAEFFYLNEIFGITIWDKESVKNYRIELPKNTIQVDVTIIENYLLRDWQNFATVGDVQTGGWVNIHTAKVYCNEGRYNFTSEGFLISYLKHEGLHFVDVKKYKNLSAADLEYRSKLAEFIYLDKELFSRLEEFIVFSNSTDRNFSHPYANYSIIKNLSKIFFNSDFEKDISKWKEIPIEKINATSLRLLEESDNFLDKNPETNRILD